MSVLELSGVSKRFGGLQALSEISLSVSSGEVLGLIGPNGAGKSTLVSCITGVLRIDGGTSALGIAISRTCRRTRRARRGIGAHVPESAARGSTDRLRKCRGRACEPSGSHARTGGSIGVPAIVGASRRQAVNRTLEQVGLGDVSGTIVKSLPFGRRHFVEIARALVSGAEACCCWTSLRPV